MAQLFRRFRRSAAPPAEPLQPVVPPDGIPFDINRHPGLSALLTAGDTAAALDLVRSRDPELTRGDLARIDLQLRNEAFRRRRATTPVDIRWPPVADTPLTDQTDIPDIPAADLTSEALIAAVRGTGALIVRGLLPKDACEQLIGMTDRAFAARELPIGADPDHYSPLCDIDGKIVSSHWRHIQDFVDAEVPAPDVPVAAEFALEQFRGLGLPGMIHDYLDEQAALSLEKWTLRRVPPTTFTSWHQDGAFLGADIHTINMWITLTDAGESAAGLDIVAKKFDHIVPTGTPGAAFDWDVSPTIVEDERNNAPIVSPVFRAGDAVFFDQHLLHRTGARPHLTMDRYALESWFFAPSAFPATYEGLLV